MLKLFQLPYLPTALLVAALLLIPVANFLQVSLRAAVQPRITARTRIQIFLSAAAYVALFFAAVLLVALLLSHGILPIG